jgi:hypothetical protein
LSGELSIANVHSVFGDFSLPLQDAMSVCARTREQVHVVRCMIPAAILISWRRCRERDRLYFDLLCVTIIRLAVRLAMQRLNRPGPAAFGVTLITFDRHLLINYRLYRVE